MVDENRTENIEETSSNNQNNPQETIADINANLDQEDDFSSIDEILEKYKQTEVYSFVPFVKYSEQFNKKNDENGSLIKQIIDETTPDQQIVIEQPIEIVKEVIGDKHGSVEIEDKLTSVVESINDQLDEELEVKKSIFDRFLKKKKASVKHIKVKTPKLDNSKQENIPTSDGGNNNNNKQKPEKTPRPKASKPVFVWAIIMSIILFFAAIGVIGAGAFAYTLCKDKPDLVVSNLIAPDSSTIYDSQGNKIMELGMYLRENVEYEEMPNCLIDAFVAVEDSRFYEHFGFDIPRFTKAILANISSGDFSQGGSTITMQLIKNTYYSIDADADSTIAAREGMSGIKRKMQEIVLSLQLELFEDVRKQDIIAMYINRVNYGNNIRGVEKAAQYYFGKTTSELNLSESAFLAGMINSPNTYNPYNDLYKYDNDYLSEDSNYLENATYRRNEVLNLMVQHGYISKAEADLAKSIKLEDQLCGVTERFEETNDKYQWYIDAVIDEVEEMTGESPYYVGMDIYTNMNPYMQELVYDIQNNEEVMEFPNELCQSAIVLMDNQTGAVEALGGGRGEVTSARQFNRATSAYLNPGSSFKPIVDYSLAFEYLGWCTEHTITDMPYYLYDGNILVSNYDHIYWGDMTITEALGRSQNTPAVQTLKAVCDKIGEDKVVDYLNSIGFKFDYEDFDLQFGIGGNRCLVTPLQLAGAHAIFMNRGMYIKPHTINYIEYVDGRDDYVADTTGTRALSEESAWMTAYLEKYNMEGSYSSLMWYCKRNYPLYGKTGTTDWADAGVEYGIPVSATKDSWLVMQTNRYTISCWTGYDELQEGAYFTQREYQENTKSKIVSLMLDELETHASYEEYDPSIEYAKPDGVKQINILRGAYPYVAGNDLKAYISASALEEQPLGTVEQALAYSASINKYIDIQPRNINGVYDGTNLTVTFEVTSGAELPATGEECDLSSSNVYCQTTSAIGRIWFPHWNPIYSGTCDPPYNFKVTYTSNGEEHEIVRGSCDVPSFTIAIEGIRSVDVYIWTTKEDIASTQTITLG